ncbi:hypothetical protein [Vulgatibacter incomptus]|uniref:Glycosyltransferase RgtA/B/C/D-like domain-containing protein n=1 Tax=Vulgatibacter incomptus TaxID=1391653 RepID=A0A0K1P917_9BACT|nr:hypothetical protein [Vulgatibacter incomptus]AKU90015.1 hypothetical protein AKJ08_0402 [Vulgatibacter incomptus]
MAEIDRVAASEAVADPRPVGFAGEALARRIAVLLVIACAMSYIGLRAARLSEAYYGNVVDDSLISMQYAKNLVEGHGLVFNVGERVEGYTNFLWVVFLSGLYLLSKALGIGLVPLAVWASVGVSMGVAGLVFFLGRRLWGGDPIPTAVALGLCALDSCYVPWAIQALEGHFLLLWILLTLAIQVARPRYWPVWVGLCMAFVVMTRPDGAIFVFAAFASQAIEVLRRARESRGYEGIRGVIIPWMAAAGVFVLVYGSYFLWRYQYFGYLLPNTFYLKVGGSGFDGWSRGFAYLAGFLGERAYVPLLAAFAIARIGHPLVRTLLVYLLTHCVYVAYVGGDFYPGHRFLLVVVPVIALLVGVVVRDLLSMALSKAGSNHRAAMASRIAVGAASLLALAIVWQTGSVSGPATTEVVRWGDRVEATRKFMLWLKERSGPDDVIALGDIGSAGFYAGLRVVDVYGVVDPVVAHSQVPSLGKGKAGHEKRATDGYVLGKRPRFIKLGYLRGDLHRQGYYLNGEMPPETGAEGIWELDGLADAERFEELASLDLRGSDWQVEGEAFSRRSPGTARPGQQPLVGATPGVVNSFHTSIGDHAIGRMTSPAFPIDGDLLVLRVGGGRDPERLRVSLLVDGVRVLSSTGRNSEVLARTTWDVEPYRGRMAVLEIVDEAVGPWGHILVDEVVQYRRKETAEAGLGSPGAP